MKFGIVSRSFPDLTHAEIAERLARNDCAVTELCLVARDDMRWNYNQRSNLEGFGREDIRRIASVYRAAGVEPIALGCFTNLIEDDPAELEANLLQFEQYLELAAAADIPTVATECGFNGGSAGRGIRTDRYESDYTRLVESLRRLCARGGQLGVDVALEPCVLDVVPSAKRMADTIRRVGSPRLVTLLDPANLIANATETEMFAHLQGRIAYVHGKDRKVDDAFGRALGEGDIDWPLVLRFVQEQGIPLILEYVSSDTYAAILQRLRAYLPAGQKPAPES